MEKNIPADLLEKFKRKTSNADILDYFELCDDRSKIYKIYFREDNVFGIFKYTLLVPTNCEVEAVSYFTESDIKKLSKYI